MAEEQSGEAELAIYVGSKIADGLVGGAVDQLISSPVLAILGIKKNDDSAEKYHQEVMSQLASLGQSLDNQVRALQATLGQIKNISTQIKDFMTQEALAQVLRDYNTNASTIENLFELFLDDVSALSDTNEAAAALTDLYNSVLTSDNAVKVSEAMSRIHDLVVQPSDFDKGILDYLLNMIQEEIQKYGETDDNYIYKFTRAYDQQHQFYMLPRAFDYYECGKIVVNAYSVARADVPKIASLFKRIISTQLRGLVFLAKAWEGSTHAPTLRQRTSDVLAEIKLMQGFYPAYCTTVDKAVADSLKKSGKYLPDELLRQFVPRRDVLSWGHQTDPGGFLLHDWIMMRLEEQVIDSGTLADRIWLVYQPWNDASKLPAGADRYCLAGKLGFDNGPRLFGLAFPPAFEQDYLDGDVHLGNSAKFDGFIYPGLTRLDTGLPAELATVLNGLPTSEEEVTQTNLNNLLNRSQHGLGLSFKCSLTSDTGVWLQGNSVTGALNLASRRDKVAGHTSSAWRVFFTLMPPNQLHNVCVKCLGFNDEDRQYLNGKAHPNELELAVQPDPDISGGTEWMIRPWPDNTISFVRIVDYVDGTTIMVGGDTRWLEGKADGSVAISSWGNDKPGLKWIVYPYMEDTGD